MAEPKEVCSPMNRKTRVELGPRIMPGARSSPSRASADSVPAQPKNSARPVGAHSSVEPAEIRVVGPEGRYALEPSYRRSFERPAVGFQSRSRA